MPPTVPRRSFLQQTAGCCLVPLLHGSSGYLWHDGLASRAARPHDDRGEPLPIRRPTAADAARYGAMGGLLTSATDYARFLLAILDPLPADGFHLQRTRLEEVSPSHRSGYVILTNGDLGWKLIQELAPVMARRVHA